MRRGRHDAEYHKVRDRAEMKVDMRRNVEFPDDDPDVRPPQVSFRVEMMRQEIREICTRETEAEIQRNAENAAKLNARRAEFNERVIRREFIDLGLDPPEPLVSLSFLKMMGWTVEEISGKPVLVKPGKQHTRKTREDWERERNGDGT